MGRRQRPRPRERFEFPIDFGTRKKEVVEALSQDLWTEWSFEYGTIN